MKSAALILLTTGMVLGASMLQTDWSGGPSGEVTTTDWGSDFGSCYGMGWQAQGALTLGTALDWAKVSDIGSLLLRECNVNGDNFSDLLSVGLSIWAYESNGNPWYWPSHLVGSADSIVTIFAGDLNGDGLDDAIGGATSLYWWENPNDPNQAWEKRLLDQCFLKGGAVIDYDSDGENDVICVHDVNAMGQLTFYKNLGDGLAWSKSILYQSDWFSGANCFTLQDVDNDGYLTATMLAQNGLDLIEDSPSGWVYQNTIGTYYTWWPTFVDLDNDGILDFIGCSGPYVYDRIRWYKGPDFNPFYTYETGDTIHGLTCIDFDSDGDMDIIYRGENSVGMFENTRSPQERFIQRVLMEYPFSNGLDSESAGGLVAPGDFDGNGVEDFVCSFYGVNYPNLYWWRLGEDYCSSGWLNSDILYVYDASWGELTWDASVPAETQIYFQVRGSDDPGNLGEWSELITEPADLSSYLADGESYLQYRVTMLSDNPDVSPQLNSVAVSYDPLGVEGNTGFGLRVFPSPVGSVATVSLALPEPAECSVSVYSLDGRLVGTVAEGSLPAGESALQWDASSVPSGVYFIRVAGGGLNAGARLVVAR
jgi:hypothetical protein